jgi:translation initiation factor IF-2
MEWWQLIIALIAIAGYVVLHIYMAWQQEQRAAAERDRAEGKLPPVEAARRDEDDAQAKSELDRRIEEAIERQRRREASPEAPAVARPVAKGAIPMALPPVVKVPRYEPVRAEPRIVPTTSKVPRPEKPRAVKPAPARGPAAAETTPTPVATARPQAPAMRQVLDLLKDRQNIAAAVVLHEVLGAPKSRRRRN